VPVGQLDGGHVAYALLGPKQDHVSRQVRRGLFAIGLAISAGTWLHKWLAGASSDELQVAMFAGANWMLWCVVLTILMRGNGGKHPPTETSELTPLRRWIGYVTLAWFVLLFMPTWLSIS